MDWVPENAIQDLLMESQLYPERTKVDVAVRILEENAPLAARRMVHLALYSENERVCYDASKFILEYAAGRAAPKQTMAMDDIAAPLLELKEAVFTRRSTAPSIESASDSV